MPTLRPFRDYDEKDVINIYAFSGSIPTNKGTIVKVVGDGFRPDVEPIEMLGNMGTFSVSNFVAQRYGTTAKVAVATHTDVPVGMMLFDVRETDENDMPLKYNPRKAAEMEAAISGQTVPLVTRGTFLYSGVVVSGGVAVAAGAKAYLGYGGTIATSGTVVVGKFLGGTGTPYFSGTTGAPFTPDNSAIALVWLNIS
jgi:hypothetical protein